MRYAEQMKYSWNYHRGVFREIWDMFTLHNWHWYVVGLLIALCVTPLMIYSISPVHAIYYYITTPVPAFAPSLTQELAITEYYSKVGAVPSIPVVANYYWVLSSGFKPLTRVVCIISIGLLLVAYLRESSPVRGREE